jgi:hypothetical protein
VTPMPESIFIRYDKCRQRLKLPGFFETSSFENIYEVLKMLQDRPRENEGVYETLDQFFPAWKEFIEETNFYFYLKGRGQKTEKICTDQETRLKRYNMITALYKALKNQ